MPKLAMISCPLDYLLNPKNPTPPKLRFVSLPLIPKGGPEFPACGEGIKGWGAMAVGIITNYPDLICLLHNQWIVGDYHPRQTRYCTVVETTLTRDQQVSQWRIADHCGRGKAPERLHGKSASE